MPAPDKNKNPMGMFRCPKCLNREIARANWAPQCSATVNGKRCNTRMIKETQ